MLQKPVLMTVQLMRVFLLIIPHFVSYYFHRSKIFLLKLNYILSAALRNLSSLYRKQGRAEAADILEKAAKGSRGERVTNQG